MKRLPLVIAILIMLFVIVTQAKAEIYQGYFLTTIKQVEHVQKYKEITGYSKVDILDPVTGLSTGEQKDVPIYEMKQDKWYSKNPDLGDSIRDWQVVATHNDKVLVYIVTSNKALALRLKDRAEYIGKSIREICIKAKQGSNLHRQIAKRLLYSIWYTGELDIEGNKIKKRGNVQEWIDAGKPERLHKWAPKLVYAGVPCPIPTSEEMDIDNELAQ